MIHHCIWGKCSCYGCKRHVLVMTTYKKLCYVITVFPGIEVCLYYWKFLRSQNRNLQVVVKQFTMQWIAFKQVAISQKKLSKTAPSSSAVTWPLATLNAVESISCYSLQFKLIIFLVSIINNLLEFTNLCYILAAID